MLIRRLALQKDLIPLRIGKQLFQQILGVQPLLLHIGLEGGVDLVHRGDQLLLDAQVITYKDADIVLCQDLNAVPVFLVVFLLLLG